MTTKEFIKRISDEIYGHQQLTQATTIGGGMLIKTVIIDRDSKDEIIEIDEIYSRKVSFHTEVSNEIFDICVEYAKTTISKRKEPKKYSVVLPDPSNNKDHVFALRKGHSGEPHIGWCHKSHLDEGLTEEEIKRNHSYLWQFKEEVK